MSLLPVKIFTSPCPSGQTGFRYKVIGRTEDMLKIKGVTIYPSATEVSSTHSCPG